MYLLMSQINLSPAHKHPSELERACALYIFKKNHQNFHKYCIRLILIIIKNEITIDKFFSDIIMFIIDARLQSYILIQGDISPGSKIIEYKNKFFESITKYLLIDYDNAEK